MSERRGGPTVRCVATDSGPRITPLSDCIEVTGGDPFETVLGPNLCGDPVVKRRSKQSIGRAHRADGAYECRPPATFHTFHPSLLNSTGRISPSASGGPNLEGSAHDHRALWSP